MDYLKQFINLYANELEKFTTVISIILFYFEMYKEGLFFDC